MEPEVAEVKVTFLNPLFKVTTFSKYFALLLFIVLPFLGGFVGYVYAPEKVVGVEKVVSSKPRIQNQFDNVYSYSKNENLEMVSRTETQRIGVKITPFLDKYLEFPITSQLKIAEYPRYIDQIDFDKNNGEILLNDNELLKVNVFSTSSKDIEKTIQNIRLAELQQSGFTPADVIERINTYLKNSLSLDETTKITFAKACPLFSWELHGSTFYALVPVDKETGTDLTQLCGYQHFVILEDLIVEDFSTSADSEFFVPIDEIRLVNKY